MPHLTKDELNALLPHAESMRLLDRVEAWDSTKIQCRTRSHLDPLNPLRRSTGLEGIAGLEYAAQAMGVHVGLLDRTKARSGMVGFVGGLRDVVIRVDRLDRLPYDLIVEAIRLFEDERSFVYGFIISTEGGDLMSGRASIFLQDAHS